MKPSSLKFPDVEVYIDYQQDQATLFLKPNVGLDSENLMQCLTVLVRHGYCKPVSRNAVDNNRPGWGCYVFRAETP